MQYRSRLCWTAAALAALCAGCRPAAPSPDKGGGTNPPAVKASIVGHQTCAECHSEIAELHAASGHSRTFSLTKNSDIARQLCGKTLDARPPFGRYEYVCDEEGLAVTLPGKFPGRLMPLDVALGSGLHAVTMVSLLNGPEGKTLGIEHRMTWYSSDGEFDITPGQEDLMPRVDGAYFGYVLEPEVLAKCLGCHTTTGQIAGTQLENLYGGVHCERCHGPASEHVAAARRGDDELARRLMHRDWTASEEIASCGKCHRVKEEIALERLARYPNSLVRFQPVGLALSRCFTESKGELRCATCHDPHGPPSTRTMAQQVATCVSCHSQPVHKVCTVSQDDCIRCHMPAIDLVRGIEFHDHWIRIRTGDAAGREKPSREGELPH